MSLRTVKVEFQVPVGEGLAQMAGVGPKVQVSTEVMLADETEEAAQSAGVEAYQTLSAFVNGWASAQ